MRMKINIILLFTILLFISCQNSETSKISDSKTVKKEEILSPFDSLNFHIKTNPNNALLYNKRANYYLIAGKYNKALADVNRAWQLDSLNTDVLVTLADIYYAKERYVDSRKVLKKAVSINPESTPALLKLARLYLIYRDYKSSMNYVNKALKVDPSLEDAYFIKAISNAENGDTAAAIYNYQKAVEMNPNYYDAWVELGGLYMAKGNPLAEQYYLNALDIDTSNTHALYVLGYYYQETGNYPKAEKYYQSLLLKADNENALFNLGYINLVYLNNYPQAIIYFQKALSINENYHEALFNLAYSLELSGDMKDARSKYQELLKKVPNHPGALKRLNEID